MDQNTNIQVDQSTRAVGSSAGSSVIRRLTTWETYQGSNRQYINRCVPKSHGWPISGTVTNRSSDLGKVYEYRPNIRGQTSSGQAKYACGSSKQNKSSEHIQLVHASQNFSRNRPNLGPSHSGSIRGHHQLQVQNIQQSVLRSLISRSRCASPVGLDQSQQFRKLSVCTHSEGPTGDHFSKGFSNIDSAVLARPAVVSHSYKITGPLTATLTTTKVHVDTRKKSRAIKKPRVEDVCLENIRSERLLNQNWSERASYQIRFALAPSTLSVYNRVLSQFRDFCVLKDAQFPPKDSCVIADFLCELGDKSERPKSLLNIAHAAINNLYRAYRVSTPGDSDISDLITALIKSGTSQALRKSSVLPSEPFDSLFRELGDNTSMSIKMLRMKCVALLATVCMLRPSDIAPKSVHFDPTSGHVSKRIFSVQDV